MADLTFEDFKNRISIKTVLEDAGYHFYRKDGLRYPSFVRLDNEGRKIRGDKFIVTANGLCCFHPPERKNYTVISFIQEHPDMFPEYTPGMNKNRLVNLVCNRLLGHIPEKEQVVIRNVVPQQKFEEENFEFVKYNTEAWETRKRFYPYFKDRCIDLKTQAAFADHFVLSCMKREDRKRYYNLAFPFRIPGKEDKIVGLEERGRPGIDGKTYKGKATGTNSVEGIWIANLSGKPLDQAEKVYWFESAYDAMAFHQLQREKGKDNKGVYLSTGGNPSHKQFEGIIKACPKAVHYLGFDRDNAGKMYACNFALLKSGREFSSYSMPGGTTVFVDKTGGYGRQEFQPNEVTFENVCRRFGLNDPQIKYNPASENVKDWNDELKAYIKQEAEESVTQAEDETRSRSFRR